MFMSKMSFSFSKCHCKMTVSSYWDRIQPKCHLLLVGCILSQMYAVFVENIEFIKVCVNCNGSWCRFQLTTAEFNNLFEFIISVLASTGQTYLVLLAIDTTIYSRWHHGRRFVFNIGDDERMPNCAFEGKFVRQFVHKMAQNVKAHFAVCWGVFESTFY